MNTTFVFVILAITFLPSLSMQSTGGRDSEAARAARSFRRARQRENQRLRQVYPETAAFQFMLGATHMFARAQSVLQASNQGGALPFPPVPPGLYGPPEPTIEACAAGTSWDSWPLPEQSGLANESTSDEVAGGLPADSLQETPGEVDMEYLQSLQEEPGEQVDRQYFRDRTKILEYELEVLKEHHEKLAGKLGEHQAEIAHQDAQLSMVPKLQVENISLREELQKHKRILELDQVHCETIARLKMEIDDLTRANKSWEQRSIEWEKRSNEDASFECKNDKTMQEMIATVKRLQESSEVRQKASDETIKRLNIQCASLKRKVDQVSPSIRWNHPAVEFPDLNILTLAKDNKDYKSNANKCDGLVDCTKLYRCYEKGKEWCSGENGHVMFTTATHPEFWKILKECHTKGYQLIRQSQKAAARDPNSQKVPKMLGIECNHNKHRSRATAHLVRACYEADGMKVNLKHMLDRACGCPDYCRNAERGSVGDAKVEGNRKDGEAAIMLVLRHWAHMNINFREC